MSEYLDLLSRLSTTLLGDTTVLAVRFTHEGEAGTIYCHISFATRRVMLDRAKTTDDLYFAGFDRETNTVTFIVRDTIKANGN